MTGMDYQPIDRFGVIGNMDTVALVGMDGSIDFLCFPFFDSPSIFARLLDHERGGFFQIAPMLDRVRHRQMYLPDTNVLFTRFLSDDGVAEISDFMPLLPGQHCIVRRVKTVRGEIRFRAVCAPRMNYARDPHHVEIVRDGAIFSGLTAGNAALRLRASVPVYESDGTVIAEFVLHAGDTATFLLEEDQSPAESPSAAPDYVAHAFKETVDIWRRWIAHSTYRGRWREMVNRSALTLKLLTSRTHGAIVAAPTFGLPEVIGGTRNWDYRYTWIRDGSFTLYGLMRLGFMDEAAAFMKWIENRCSGLSPDGTLQIMYRIDGSHDLGEEELPHLRGYMGSKPVLIGNAAHRQLQLDVYGELLTAVHVYDKYGQPISHDLWMNLRTLVDWVSHHWRVADEGIWEVRGGRREFLLSRVMCWAALDRAIAIARRRSFPAPLDRWQRVRDEIYDDIFAGFWSQRRSAFVRHLGGETTDASALLMPLVKFIGATDPRWLSTLRAIEEDLVDDSLVYRYRSDRAPDGLAGSEGTFCICSFWYVECLARSGDVDQARYYFEKMLGYANHLGLYPEELGPSGEHLGNFPQAFTHIGLISAAHYLDRALSRRDA